MTQIYTDPTRESDPHALPDAETLYHVPHTCAACEQDTCTLVACAWYWQARPHCSKPVGPFDTKALAIADARKGGAA